MLDELSRVLAVNGYLPHGYCISWSPALLTTYVVSDMLIFLSYFSMPVALGYFAHRRRDFPYRWLLWLFALFIMACGTTHLMGAVVIWQPLYGLDAALKAVTALVSVITAVMLWPLLPHALKLPSPDQLKRINAELEREIGERKRAEAALQQAKAAVEDSLQNERNLMAAIVESSEDAIIGNTLDGIVTSWNPAAERIFGYSAAEIVGRSMRVLIPAEISEEETTIFDRVHRGESVMQREAVRVCRDGRRIDVSVTISPIRDLAGRIIGTSKIAHDITEKRRAEARIHELNAELEQKVVARTAELRAANAELDAFAYAVSHDLRTPLRAMGAFSKILIEDFGGKLEPQAKECLGHIITASTNMGRLIDGLLTLSRATRGDILRAPVDISSLAQRIREELEHGDPGRAVTWEIEPDLSAWGDERMLDPMLRNLLDNAWKYTARATAPHIRIYSALVEGKRSICIADNGAGFNMAYAEQLFQPFRRLHRQDEFPGLGIGLATVQRIVHRHGGSIQAKAVPGQGAEFFFSLPEGEASETT